ncbi:probable G-protein coupled receptor B0563.6 [Aplysia californica]|uniref:Probable G-protein coupled receptor B0563.6 n=1 Tax=Aplysia californica TaxID=6500 RepID=A0ABM0JM16_APLCA|nr:probable G-protein coupled receptor B0563.6 [Aplysia californica]
MEVPRNGSQLLAQVQPHGFISDRVFQIVYYYVLTTFAHMAIQIFGIATNVLNIFIFSRIGGSDGITVSLLALSVADFLYLIFVLILTSLTILMKFSSLEPSVSFPFLGFLIVWYGNVSIDSSMAITVFIALQKCACVAIPLVFQNAFTRSRCVVVLLTIFAMMFLSYLPMNISHRIQPRFNPLTNRTELVYKSAPHFAALMSFYLVFNRTVLPVISLTTVIVCLLILTVKLEQSARFRSNMKSNYSAARAQPEASGTKSTSGKTGNVTDRKEIYVIKTVAFVSAIFIGCYIPYIEYPVEDFSR